MMFPVVRANGRNLFPTFSPWAELSNDVDRWFGGSASSCPTMPVDIREEGNDLLIKADLPGVAQNEVEVTVENGELTISANHKAESEQKEANYFIQERRTANVARTFRLPETVDLDKVAAELANGVLTLRIPKKEEAKPRQIQVK